jgi:hypothetical protein
MRRSKHTRRDSAPILSSELYHENNESDMNKYMHGSLVALIPRNLRTCLPRLGTTFHPDTCEDKARQNRNSGDASNSEPHRLIGPGWLGCWSGSRQLGLRGEHRFQLRKSERGSGAVDVDLVITGFAPTDGERDHRGATSAGGDSPSLFHGSVDLQRNFILSR